MRKGREIPWHGLKRFGKELRTDLGHKAKQNLHIGPGERKEDGISGKDGA
jgi:hypothetical protein